ncbi:MAG: helix-turn-helix domain-containing protein [Candidatus Hodarchaeota archaeon]
MADKTLYGLTQLSEAGKKRAIIEMIHRTDTSPVDLLQCFFGLSNLEICTFLLVREGTNSVNEISEKINRNTSTVHRLLRRLFQLGFLHRERIPREGQGYHYQYTAVSAEDLAVRIKKLASEIRSKVEKLLEQVDWLEEISAELLSEV